mgnify:FL=1
MEKTEIKHDGQEVSCFGQWEEDSNAVCIFEDKDGYSFDEIFADGAVNWTDAVKKVSNWAKDNKCKLVEMQVC